MLVLVPVLDMVIRIMEGIAEAIDGQGLGTEIALVAGPDAIIDEATGAGRIQASREITGI